MKSLTAEELLYVWEQGLNQPLLQRMLILLIAAFPEMQPDSIAKMSIGQRDQCLLQLRERLFGQQLLNTAVCPECDERIEWQSNIADFLITSDESSVTANEFGLEADDYKLLFRLPNSLDIGAVVNSESAAESTGNSQQQLLSRCLLKIEHCGASCAVDQLPEAVIQTLIQRIEALDPQADIRINLTCPECSHRWDVLFDIAGFLWVEINDWAERTLQMVYKLAVGYGWSEREILNLSPVRRQLYLGMMGS